MMLVHCSKFTLTIGQNQSHVFWLSGKNDPFEALFYKTDENGKTCVILLRWLQILRKIAIQWNEDQIRSYMKHFLRVGKGKQSGVLQHLKGRRTVFELV